MNYPQKCTIVKPPFVIKRTLLAAAIFVSLGSISLMAPQAGHALSTSATSISSESQSLAPLVEAVKPAVVSVQVTGHSAPRRPTQRPNLQPAPGSQLDDFLRRFYGPGARGRQDRHGRQYQGSGSGFIVDAKGWIVTNAHVVEQADKINIQLDSGKILPATVIGTDKKTDIALLKIEAEQPLPFVTLGDSDKARVGDQIIAIGNPFGLGNTVTTGIISARSRDLQAGPYDDFIQIDAPINRGNSGGPLFNLAGDVVGINTAIFSPNGGNIGIGFAIPSEQVKRVVQQLKEKGKVDRGWLGVQIQAVTEDIQTSLGLKDTSGALVSMIEPDSPANKAGVRPGDVILSYNQQPIKQLRDLPKLVAAEKTNAQATLSVWRNEALKKISVTIAPYPEDDIVAVDQQGKSEQQVGLSLSSATAELRQRFRIADRVKGPVVVAVRPDSAAANAGIRPGDVLVGIGQTLVSSPSQAASLFKTTLKTSPAAIAVLINRAGRQHFVTMSFS